MTDAELKHAMKVIAAVNGLPLSDERIERDAANYRDLLDSIARIRAVDLPLEAEPSPFVALTPARGDARKASA